MGIYDFSKLSNIFNHKVASDLFKHTPYFKTSDYIIVVCDEAVFSSDPARDSSSLKYKAMGTEKKLTFPPLFYVLKLK